MIREWQLLKVHFLLIRVVLDSYLVDSIGPE